MDVATESLENLHFGPPLALPAGPLLPASVVGNAGSSAGSGTTASGSPLGCGGGFDIIKGPGRLQFAGRGMGRRGSLDPGQQSSV